MCVCVCICANGLDYYSNPPIFQKDKYTLQ